MLGADLVAARCVEVLHIPGADLHCTDAEADVARVQPVEVDELEQRLAQRARVIKADRLECAGWHDDGGRHPRLEESRRAGRCDHRRARLVEDLTRDVAGSERREDQPARHPVPEFPEPLDAGLVRVAGDDGRVHGADRNARDPADVDAQFVKTLIHARLEGAERSAALQQ